MKGWHKKNIMKEQTGIFGGLEKYFIDFEDYEFSIYCYECGNEKLKYLRTTSNNEVHWCEKCEREQIKSIKPKEDSY